MASSEVHLNQFPNEPELKDVLLLHKQDVLISTNCHAIGTIQSFDPETQTATATINYVRTYFRPDSKGVYRRQTENYPILTDCPVVCLGGGKSFLTLPITKGDECLILFNDRDLDNWFNGNGNGALATGRLHSFSDAVILVGIRSLANVIDDYDPENPEIRTTQLRATFGDEGFLAFLNQTGELVKALQDLATAIQSGTAGGFPLVFPPEFATALNVITSFVRPP